MADRDREPVPDATGWMGRTNTRILPYNKRIRIGRPMKQKLTVTVDAELIPVAKRHARTRGMSLSSMIEQSLREAIGESTPSFASKWRGSFRPAERDDPRYAALARKYLR